VVEADEGVRLFIAGVLEDRGYRVSSADSGALMRLLLAAGDHGIDAVILDATIGGTGIASLALHANERGLPVVMISGNLERMEFAQTHGLQLLWKPFRALDLVKALDAAFASGIPGQRDA
jgi:DNA-binding response OmpR family regulator